jgi:hypothetical protein
MRQSATLRYDQTLFRDREIFEFTYMPDELPTATPGCLSGP